MKGDKRNHLLYFKGIMTSLETAQKIIIKGVRQFFLLSSMSVYIIEKGIIRADTF